MSMEGSAVDRIQELALSGHDALQPVTDQTVMLAPGNWTIHDLEQYEKTRSRFRGMMTTKSLTSFVYYVADRMQPKNKDEDEAAACFVDQDKMAAVTILNLGTNEFPGHCDDRAVLQLEKTPEYEALLDYEDEAHNQRRLAEFLEDWRDYITCYTHDSNEEDGARKISIIQAIAAVRNMAVTHTREGERSEGNFSESASAFEKMELKDQDQFPASVHFTARPYEDLTVRDFKLRVSTSGSGDKNLLHLRMVRKGKVMEEIAQEFAELVDQEFTSTEGLYAPVYLGGFRA